MITITINITNQNTKFKSMEQKKLARRVRTFEDYYNAMIRDGWLLPSFNSAIVTRPYLDAIRGDQYYCPHVRDNILPLRCPNPPPKMELLKLWKKAVYKKVLEEPTKEITWNAMLATITLIEEEGKLPNNEWLLTVLSHIEGRDSVVFQKDYKYEKPKNENQKPDIMFDNFDGLFDNLPELDDKQIRRTNQFRVPKQVKMM